MDDGEQDSHGRECCPACGVAYVEHMGLIGTCSDLQWHRARNVRLATVLRKMIRVYLVDDQAWDPEADAERIYRAEVGDDC